jgi:hypothetical protein
MIASAIGVVPGLALLRFADLLRRQDAVTDSGPHDVIEDCRTNQRE